MSAQHGPDAAIGAVDFDFTPATRARDAQRIVRPSLTYWQDAWLRLRRNPRAIASLYIVIGLLVFTIFGPMIWTVDPARQDLDRVSIGPSLGTSALIVPAREPWPGVVRTQPRATDPNAPLPAPGGLATVEPPTTQWVRIAWSPVPGASGYAVYRNTHAPENRSDLGLPIGATRSGDEVGYEDMLDLRPRSYWYSVVPVAGLEESESFATLEVTTRLAITPVSAVIKGIVDDPDALKPGATIALGAHPLGTDMLGRDMLARLMLGARVSLFIGLLAPLIFVALGTLYGGIAGYVGGWVDAVMMRFADFVVALPFLLFMILFRITSGVQPGESGMAALMVALVVLSWPATARLVRGQILQIREEAYVDAARLMGASRFYLVARHMIPNTLGVILVTITFAVPTAIFTEAFLSFIGMGVAPPTPSWGSMCNEGIKTMQSHPHELILPAVFISITVLAFNLLGDGLRDALDARMRGRG